MKMRRIEKNQRGQSQTRIENAFSCVVIFAVLFLLFCLTLGHIVLAAESEESIELVETTGGFLFHPLQRLKRHYRWLFERLIPPAYRSAAMMEKAKRSFFIHMRDSLDFFPDPKEMPALKIPSVMSSFMICGSLSYAQIVALPYRYDVSINRDGNVTLTVRVHLKNASEQELQWYRLTFSVAEDLWNSGKDRFPLGFPYRFRFVLETDRRRAHFSVKLQDRLRGPYPYFWKRTWSGRTVAHKLGHMMGLGDEYRIITRVRDCIQESLMCRRRLIMEHHYYFILRRLFTAAARPERCTQSE